jgi:aryl-alcohol dehydrogenase-like predicted oxidoreductase
MVRLLEEAADAGVTFYDTASVYIEGESERLLGEVLGARAVVIATKIGATARMPSPLLATARSAVDVILRRRPWLAPAAARESVARKDFSPAALRLAVDGCRRRLRRERLDLVQLHSPPVGVLQREDAFETLERLKAEGSVRFYGVSFGTRQPPPSLAARTAIATLQFPASVLDAGDVEAAALWAEPRGVGLIGNQPFRKGRLLWALRKAGSSGVGSPADAALRAVTALRGLSSVLVGTTSVQHLRQDIAAVEAPPLSSDELAGLRSLLGAGPTPRGKR